jgi:transposase-like protein
MKAKKRSTSEEKTMILRERLENRVPISDLAEQYNIHPNAIYKWKKQLFEAASDSFSGNSKRQTKKQSIAEKRIEELERTLAVRESLIADLVEDNIALKKNIRGDSLTRNGLSRKSETMW